MANFDFHINENSNIPKYKQLINAVLMGIETKKLQKGDKIPSLTHIMKEHNLSRDTVVNAFNELKIRGIISSTPGKGYYIKSSETDRKLSVFLLFDELNAFKEKLYHSFINEIQSLASVDIHFHYFNQRVFHNLIVENASRYNTFIIMPVNFTGIKDTLKEIKNANIFMLDQLNKDASNLPVIYQDFEQDMYNALYSGIDSLKKYEELTLVYPGGKEPIGQKIGFEKFCIDYRFKFSITNSLKSKSLGKGQVYIVPDDNDLVEIIKQCKKLDLKIGNDIGIISYNDTPLKEVVADGITTISTDFEEMGKKLASMVLSKSKKQIRNSSRLILRNSL